MGREQLLFQLKDELMCNTPDRWDGIRERIAAAVATKLLKELEGVPSPRGRLFGELRDVGIPNTYDRGA